MSKITKLAKKAFTNPAILYIISRYGTYVIQFVNSLLIAVYLGPYYLGVWGFINLIIGYIGQFNLGISHSVNIVISIEKNNEDYVKRVVGNGITMILLLSLFVFLFLLIEKLGIIQIGTRYNFNKYILPFTVIALLTHINAYFSNIFRVYGKIYAIAINQSLYPIIVLFLFPFFKGENLLWAMLYANSVAFIISFILYLIQCPIKVKPIFEWRVIKLIQKKGWHLFIYNTSFYFILLSTKSFISGNYEVREFGYFTFSYSLANAILLLLNSISFLIFPKLLNRFANSTNEHINKILLSVRSAYVSLSHLLVHLVIMLFPLFLLLFPDYKETSLVFKITALTVVMYTNSFGYQGVLMARGKEKLLSFIAFGALVLNVVLSTILVFVINVSFHYVILSTLITYFLYVTFIGIKGKSILGTSASFYSTIIEIFPWRMMIPLFVSLIFIFIETPEWFFTIPFIIFIALNYKDVLSLKTMATKIINNPNIINI